MSNTTDTFDPWRELTEHADHLNGIQLPQPDAEPFYELMSGALIWPDETDGNTPANVIWALRILWAYRTSLMVGKPREELAAFWQFGLEKFPQWVGFRAKRRQPTPELLRIYRAGDIGLRKCLRDAKHAEEAT